MRKFILATLVSVSFTTPIAANAAEILLVSPDRTVSFRGEFLAFDQDHYVILRNGFEIRVPAALMICQGVDCLQFEQQPEPVNVKQDIG